MGGRSADLSIGTRMDILLGKRAETKERTEKENSPQRGNSDSKTTAGQQENGDSSDLHGLFREKKNNIRKVVKEKR